MGPHKNDTVKCIEPHPWEKNPHSKPINEFYTSVIYKNPLAQVGKTMAKHNSGTITQFSNVVQ